MATFSSHTISFIVYKLTSNQVAKDTYFIEMSDSHPGNVATPVLVLTPSNGQLLAPSPQPTAIGDRVHEFLQEGLYGFGNDVDRCICVRSKEARFITLVAGLIILILGVLSNSGGIVFLGILIILVFIVCQISAVGYDSRRGLRLARMGLGPGRVDGNSVYILANSQMSSVVRSASVTVATCKDVPTYALATYYENSEDDTSGIEIQCQSVTASQEERSVTPVASTLIPTSSTSSREQTPQATNMSTRLRNERNRQQQLQQQQSQQQDQRRNLQNRVSVSSISSESDTFHESCDGGSDSGSSGDSSQV